MGRVGGAWRGLVWGAAPVGALAAGTLASIGGLRLPLVLAGVLQCAVALFLARPLLQSLREGPASRLAAGRAAPGSRSSRRPTAPGADVRTFGAGSHGIVGLPWDPVRAGRRGQAESRSGLSGTVQSQVLNRFRRYLDRVRGWRRGHQRGRKVGGLHGDDECSRRRVHHRWNAACRRRRRRTTTPGSRLGRMAGHRRHLRLLRSPSPWSPLALCLKGPLQGLGPIREIIPQGRCSPSSVVLWAVADWVPVSLHYRGNTYPLRPGGRAAPHRAGLPLPQPPRPQRGLRRCLRLRHPSPPGADEGDVQRRLQPRSRTAIAAVVFRELLGTHSPVSLVGWAAAAAALVASQLVVRPRPAGRHPAGRPDRRRSGRASSCWPSRRC